MVDDNKILYIIEEGQQIRFLFTFELVYNNIEILYANLIDKLVVTRSDDEIFILKEHILKESFRDIYSLYLPYFLIEEIQTDKIQPRNQLTQIILQSRNNTVFLLYFNEDYIQKKYQKFKQSVKKLRILNLNNILISDLMSQIVILDFKTNKIIQSIQLDKLNQLIEIQEITIDNKEHLLTLNQTLYLEVYTLDKIKNEYRLNQDYSHQKQLAFQSQSTQQNQYENKQSKNQFIIKRVKFDLQKNRIFFINQFFNYIEVHSFFKDQENAIAILDIPDIDSQIEIFENYIFVYNPFQINIFNRVDLSFVTMHKQSYLNSTLQKVYEVTSNLFLLNWSNENVLAKLQIIEDFDEEYTTSQYFKLQNILTLNKDKQRIISIIYYESLKEIQLLSTSSNQIYDQRFTLMIGSLQSCYEDIKPKDQYHQKQKFDDIIRSFSILDYKIKRLILNIYIKDEFFKSSLNLNITDFLEVRLIAFPQGILNYINEQPSQITNMNALDLKFYENPTQTYVQDASQISGIKKFILKNISFLYYAESEIYSDVTKNQVGFGKGLQQLVMEDILIENQDLYKASFFINDINLLYIKNFIIKNCNFFSSSLFKIQSVKKVFIENFQVYDSNLENSIILLINQSDSIQINNITFINNFLYEFESNFVQILNSTNLNIETLTLNDNQNTVDIYDVQRNSNNSTSFQLLYFIIFNLVQEIHMKDIVMENNRNSQLLNITSTLYENLKSTTIFTSSVQINNMSVQKNKLFQNIQKLNLSLDDVQFEIPSLNITTLQMGFINIADSFVNINNSSFNNNSSPLTQGLLSLQKLKDSQFLNCSFQNNQAGEGGAIFLDDYTSLQIENSIFINNSANFSGGAILVNKMSTLSIINSLFQNNTSLSGGAIRSRLNNKIYIDVNTKNQFKNNNAIYYGNNYGEVNKLQLSIVKINCFSLGSISSSSNNNSIDPTTGNDSIDECFKNYSIQNNDNNQTGIIEGLRSGSSLSFKVQIKDQDNRLFGTSQQNEDQNNVTSNFINSEFRQINIFIESNEKDQLIIQNDIMTNLQRYSQSHEGYIFENVQFKLKDIDNMNITDASEQTHNFYFSLSSLIGNVSEIIHTVKFQIKIRVCQEGEYYVKEKSNSGGIVCALCDKGTYSLENPMLSINSSLNNSQINSCKECPQSSYQCYHNQIFIKNGYWRSKINSDQILHCSNEPSNCLAQDNNNQQQVCKEGHLGPLCESCDNYGTIWHKQYVKAVGFKCRECSSHQRADVYIIILLIMIGTTIYLYVQVRNHNQSVLCQQLGYYIRMMGLASIYTSCFRNGNRYKIKILFYSLQIINSINRIQFYIPSFLDFFIFTFGSPSTSISLQTQCILLKQPNNYELTIPLLYSQSIIVFLSPFMYWIAIISLQFGLQYFKIVNSKNTFLITSFVLLSLYLQPNVVALIASALSCRRIGDKLYIMADVQYECFDQFHQRFVYFFFIPAIIFWVIVPLIFLKQLATITNQKRESFQMLYKYGYLYSEYKSKYFYWEFIKILLRMQATIATTLFQDYYQQTQTFNLLLFVLYLIALFRLQPYKFKILMNLDILTHILLIFMILLNLQHNFYLTEKEQNIFLSILWMSIFLSYLMYITFTILSESYKVIILPFIVQKLDYLSNHIGCLKNMYSSIDQSARKNKVMVFKRWRLVYVNLTYLICLKISRPIKNSDEINASNSLFQQSDINLQKNNTHSIYKSSNSTNLKSTLKKKQFSNYFFNNNLLINTESINNNKQSLNQSSSSSINSQQSPIKINKDEFIKFKMIEQSIQNSQIQESEMPDNINEINNFKHVNNSNQNSIRSEENINNFGKSEMQFNNIESITENSEFVKISSLNRNMNITTIVNLNAIQQKISDANKHSSDIISFD